MITALRRLFGTRLGVAFALLFVALIGLIMVLGDVSNQLSGFGNSGVQGGEVIRAGDQVVTEKEFEERIAQSMQQVQQQSPGLDRATFARTGGVDRVLRLLLDSAGLNAFGKDQGMGAGKKLIDGAIASIPAFFGPDGKFSEGVFRGILAQSQITEAQVRSDIETGVIAQQILDPIKSGAYIPPSVVRVYAEVQLESRTGYVLDIPASAVPAGPAPTEAEIKAFYDKNKARYTMPERRVVRMAPFGIPTVGAQAMPTDAEIQDYYNKNAATYGAKETRTVTQIVLSDQNSANTIANKVKGGMSFDQAAKESGLAATKLEGQEKAAYASAQGSAAADAVFAAKAGAIVGPVKSNFGWNVVKVDTASTSSGKSLAAARGEIVEKLTADKSLKLISEIDGKISTALDDGQNFDQITKANNLQSTTSPEITADGIEYGKGGQPVLPPQIVSQLFLMGVDDDPAVIPLDPGKVFALVDVSRVIPAAPRPLAEIKDQVTKDLVAERQQAAAKKIADTVIAKVQKGMPLAQAAAESGVSVSQRTLTARRQDLQQRSADSPALALMFSMAPKTAKRLEKPGNQGWSVVVLDKVEKTDLSKSPEILVLVERELLGLQGDEFQSQFADAARIDIGATYSNETVARIKRTMMGDGNS